MKWVYSTGGPLVALPRSALSKWRGVEGSSELNTGGKSDYQRACEINDYLGILSVGKFQALVLGDDPMQTCFLALSDGTSGDLVRWKYAPSEEAIIDMLSNTRHAIDIGSLEMEVAGSPLLLIDAGLAGDRVRSDDIVEMHLDPGLYSISTQSVSDGRDVAVIVHSIRQLLRT